MTSHIPPLPHRPDAATPIPAAVRPVEFTTDLDLIGRVRAGLIALKIDCPDAESHCHDRYFEEERQPDMHPDEEVRRVLARANPNDVSADEWVVVTLTRPRGSTDPVWRPFAAYGPMPLATANEFLSKLGLTAVKVARRSDFPILENLLPPRQ